MGESSHALAAATDSAARETDSQDAGWAFQHILHELRQPLSAIESIAYYLEMVLIEPRTREQVESLRQQVHRIDWMLCDAACFLRACPPRPRTASLTDLVAENLAQWGESEEPSVQLRFDEPLPAVQVDLTQAHHLLRNVRAFLCRVSRLDEPLTLRAWAAGAHVVLEAAVATRFRIEDGRHLAHAWELAVASRIAETHGGRLELRSDGAYGLTLTITLPAA